MPGEWNVSLCDCCHDGFGSCIYAWCFPQCAMASARSQYDSSDCLFNFCCASPAMLQNIVREGYGINGTCCGDIIETTFCIHCAAARLQAEVKSRGPVTMQK